MNDKIKSQNSLLIGALAFCFVILLGFITQDKKGRAYEISNQEMQATLLQKDYMVTPDQLFKNISNTDQVIIDLRTPFEFEKSHIPGAINIPFQNMYAEEYEEIWNNKDKKILYHDHQSKACAPFMLLTETGVSNCKVLLGGFDYFQKKYLLKEGNVADFRDEQALFDFAKLIDNKKAETNSTTKRTVKKPMKRKKKKSVDGGC